MYQQPLLFLMRYILHRKNCNRIRLMGTGLLAFTLQGIYDYEALDTLYTPYLLPSSQTIRIHNIKVQRKPISITTPLFQMRKSYQVIEFGTLRILLVYGQLHLHSRINDKCNTGVSKTQRQPICITTSFISNVKTPPDLRNQNKILLVATGLTVNCIYTPGYLIKLCMQYRGSQQCKGSPFVLLPHHF